MAPEIFHKSTILLQKIILRSRKGNSMIIEQLILPIIVRLGSRNKKSAKILEN